MNSVSSDHQEPPRTPPVATDMMDENPNFSTEFPIYYGGLLMRPTAHVSEYMIRSNSPHERGGWIVVEVESDNARLASRIGDIFDSEGGFTRCRIPSVMELKNPEATFLLGVDRDSGESVRDLFSRVEDFVAGYIARFNGSLSPEQIVPVNRSPRTAELNTDTLRHRLEIVLKRELNVEDLPSDVLIHLHQIAALMTSDRDRSTDKDGDDPPSLDTTPFSS